MRSLFDLVGRFRSDQRGNIAVIFVIALLPVLSAIGCAIDYSRAAQIRSKLQAAADAASVGSIAKTSPAFIAAGSMTVDGPIPAGATDASNIFNGNMTGVTGYTLNSVSRCRDQDRAEPSPQSFSSPPISQTMFLGVMGKSAMTVTGTSTSTANMPLSSTSTCCWTTRRRWASVRRRPMSRRWSTTRRTSARLPATISMTPTTTTISQNPWA